MRFIFIIFLLCLTTLFADENKDDSLEGFFGQRFSLYPPTEDESRAVTKTIKAFLEHISSNNPSEAYFQDTNSEFKAATSFDNFNLFLQKFQGLDLKQPLDYHLVNFENNDKTSANVIMIYPHKQKYQKSYIEFTLKYDDDDKKWNISGIKVYETFKSGR